MVCSVLAFLVPSAQGGTAPWLPLRDGTGSTPTSLPPAPGLYVFLALPYPTNAVNCGRTSTRAFPGREGRKTSNNSIPTTLALFWQRPDYSACWEREGWGNGALSRGSSLPWSMSPHREFQSAQQTAHRQGFSMAEERDGWELFPLSQVRKSGAGDGPSSFLSLSVPLKMLVQPQC